VNGKKRILIADDNPKVLLILKATLERMEAAYTIVTARNGKEALREFEKEVFDLVITDVRMPGLDGIELVEEIRALDTETAIIWITAYGCKNLHDDRIRLNVHHCLDKPLRIGEIRYAALKALDEEISRD
jgi:YesN/AraC family two-component response regulator